MSNNEIAILDFGSQYTHLIARRIREIGVISHIYPNDTKAEKLTNAVGIILSGGPKSVTSSEKLEYDTNIFKQNKPILGLCYGHQLIAQHFGSEISSGKIREYGIASLKISDSPIFNNIKKQTTVWMSHGDNVEKLPKNFKQIGTTGNNSITAMSLSEKNIYSFQFHPEVNHSIDGKTMLENFVLNICNAEKNWNTNDMLLQIQENIRKEAKNKKIFLLISGGVDSTICFTLLEKTLGKDKVYGFHIDHGFMRLNESEQVKEALTNIGLDDLHIYNASKEYFESLKKVYEPEEKRKIIGNLFLDITDKIMKKLNFNEKDWLLGQGTIYPDTIESGGTKNSDKIKTHHNRVDRIQKMIQKGLIIEPIKELYKDEVRKIGLKLNLPKNLINRQPFPGPGLAIRCLCSEGNNKKPITISEGTKLPIKSVGVQGDERSYKHPLVLTNTKINWQKLHKISPKITNKYKNINRVLITIYGNEEQIKNSTLKKSYLTKERISLLRQLDNKINKIVNNNKNCSHIWQMPIVLIPFGYNHKESIVIRPVESEEAMTVNFAKLPKNVIKQIQAEIEIIDKVDFVFFDITNKPPGTIEWE
ncbi:MAG: hypothetical protein A2725_03755 [Candidatus Magasanikbacteria bacterium RIFCSPHIGHO2_01_FULL_33_34]|uniref:GMP synthase (glutamine-hydrolyzing) n=1 Tax=Candidatus Magasanikbacteria bacterium RIFCSPHIGHO2_01_FULL_33_34 TaxID=1798671 RepID=A0A1F6LHP1_9BACT|nr:MAG: hypothetical protein A2725_03755 [Candidatus Magasanikbacteria bacterium RIFCSPHIGHO2_01_FULL_33_34]OGH65087.1 MAG: hypothetical protein A3B83_03515 [Candidatus Magasanikbacteria bacterium RIFCSPHIGHO2_02_FULL_33_17]OGH75370.1 MAG: hypothetical protein A3A89_04650 [Candidatus Magasanikbacteria bacterium RIFCSPLOWO2_01_FULL_33_34]OGH82334.1 MAG: hypothetical protein A3F93_02470 [Candidatus Magasanikbacteria bacterium RIFCSPLOWO2_12_FULL_34_7]